MSARSVTARWRRWRRGSVDPTAAQIRRSTAGFEVDRPDPATDGELAVLVLEVSWALGDAAHDFPAGRVTAQQREELAATLEGLAALVRASAPDAGGAGRGAAQR